MGEDPCDLEQHTCSALCFAVHVSLTQTPQCDFYKCFFAENFQFSCAQLSVESRENCFFLVGPASSQVLPCEQEPHEVLLSGAVLSSAADPALRH